MTNQEFKKYIEAIIGMCVDYLMNGISRETLVANLKLLIKQL